MSKESEVVSDFVRFLRRNGGAIAGNMMGQFYTEHPRYREQITQGGKRNVKAFCECHPSILSFSLSDGPPGTIALANKGKAKGKAAPKFHATAVGEAICRKETDGDRTSMARGKYNLCKKYTMCCKWFHGECKYRDTCSFLHDDNGWNPCKYGSSCTRDHKARAIALRSLWEALLTLLQKNDGRLHVGSGLAQLYKLHRGEEFRSLIKDIGGTQELCMAFGSDIAFDYHVTDSGASQPMITLQNYEGVLLPPNDKVALSVELANLPSNEVQKGTRDGHLFKVSADMSRGYAVITFKDALVRDHILSLNESSVVINSTQVELKPYREKSSDVPTKLFVGWKIKDGLECGFCASDLVDFIESECEKVAMDKTAFSSSSMSAKYLKTSQSQASCDERLATILAEISANECCNSVVSEALSAMQAQHSKLEEAEKRMKSVLKEEWSRLQAHEHMLRDWEGELQEKEEKAAFRCRQWEDRLRVREAALGKRESSAPFSVEKKQDTCTHSHVWLVPPSGEDGWDQYHDESTGKYWWFHEASARWFFEGDAKISSA